MGSIRAEEIRECVRSLRDELVRLTQDLVRQPSVTGDEAGAQTLLAERLREWGLAVDVWRPDAAKIKSHRAYCDDGLPVERPNLVARWGDGKPGEAAALILNGHIDVVPAGDPAQWSDDPFSGVVRDGRIFGRGACDMKGGLAACCFAVRVAQKLGVTPARAVLIQSVIGEETGGLGTLAAILRGYHADAAVIAEPTRLEMCPIHAGALSFRIRICGRSAHGAMREEGVSAIEKFWPVWTALGKLESRRNREFHHALFKPESLAAPLSVGKISAGNWVSTVPEELVAEGRFGVLPTEDCGEARRWFEEAVRDAAMQDDWLREHAPQVEWIEGQFEPGETPANAAILPALTDAHLAMTGKEIRGYGAPYGCDLRLFTRYGRVPAVLYGPGDVRVAHSADECVAIDELEAATGVLALLVCRAVSGEYSY
jgi:acetylornithine deacetylase